MYRGKKQYIRLSTIPFQASTEGLRMYFLKIRRTTAYKNSKSLLLRIIKG
jgi:hypothetical protein